MISVSRPYSSCMSRISFCFIFLISLRESSLLLTPFLNTPPSCKLIGGFSVILFEMTFSRIIAFSNERLLGKRRSISELLKPRTSLNISCAFITKFFNIKRSLGLFILALILDKALSTSESCDKKLIIRSVASECLIKLSTNWCLLFISFLSIRGAFKKSLINLLPEAVLVLSITLRREPSF